MRKILILGALISLVLAGGAAAVPGNDLNALYQNAQPGEVILIDPGTYPAQTILLDPDKVGSFAPVVFKAQGAATFASLRLGNNKIDGPDNIVFEDFKVTGSTWVINSDDITLRNHKTGVLAAQGNDRLKWLGGEAGPWTDGVNNFFGSCVGAVPTTCLNNDASTDNVIDGVYFHDYTISSPEPHSECFQTGALGGKNWRLTIKNSVFQNCTDFGMLLQGNLIDLLVANNMVDVPMPGDVATSLCNPACPRNGSSIRVDERGGLNGIKLLYNSALGAITIDNGTPVPQNVEMRGNVGTKPTGSFFCGGPGMGAHSHNAWKTNSCGPTDVSLNSFTGVFVDPETQDGTMNLHLAANSPLIGKGGAESLPVEDIDGDPRPEGNGPEIGADENATPCPPVASAPFALCVVQEDASFITFGWWPVDNAIGYRFFKDNVLVSHTWNGQSNTVQFSKPGAFAVEAIFAGPRAESE